MEAPLASENVLRVRISEFLVARPPAILRVSGLGSCVALGLFDPKAGLAGLAHILLPGPAPDSVRGSEDPRVNRYKYADQAIEGLLQAMEREGATLAEVKAKIAGGSTMFSQEDGFGDARTIKDGIGARNVEAVKAKLAELNIPIAGEDSGGKSGRTISFDPATGIMSITTKRSEAVEI